MKNEDLRKRFSEHAAANRAALSASGRMNGGDLRKRFSKHAEANRAAVTARLSQPQPAPGRQMVRLVLVALVALLLLLQLVVIATLGWLA